MWEEAGLDKDMDKFQLPLSGLVTQAHSTLYHTHARTHTHTHTCMHTHIIQSARKYIPSGGGLPSPPKKLLAFRCARFLRQFLSFCVQKKTKQCLPNIE